MRFSRNLLVRLIAVTFVLTAASYGIASGQDPQVRSIPNGEEVKKLKGIVIKREPDVFTMTETTGGPATTVLLTPSTEVKSHKRGVFRGSKEYASSYILRGLRLEV